MQITDTCETHHAIHFGNPRKLGQASECRGYYPHFPVIQITTPGDQIYGAYGYGLAS